MRGGPLHSCNTLHVNHFFVMVEFLFSFGTQIFCWVISWFIDITL